MIESRGITCRLRAGAGTGCFPGTGMLRISFLERVVAVRAGKVAFSSLVRADSHREVGERVAFTPDLELLVTSQTVHASR